ncbi:hypothetical protein KM043_008029 [Ampulex compressa]|nr:hypothetical protein KM043_008029 [Ampulex compressa]
MHISPCTDEITPEKCKEGEVTQAQFSENEERDRGPIRLIHSDVCGSIQTTAPSGNRYFLNDVSVLLDDYSRFMLIRLMKTKDQAAEAIEEYIAAMATRIEKKPLTLRTDKGREYISRELESFLRREGVEH